MEPDKIAPRRKPPIYYIQKYYCGENQLKHLGSWMLRELISFLDVTDFTNFVLTCQRFSKYASDPYVKHSISYQSCCLVHEEVSLRTIQKSLMLEKMFSEGCRPSMTELVEPMMLSIFYFNPKRNLFYSFYRNNLKISKLESWSHEPVYLQTVTAIPDMVQGVGYGKQIYLASKSSLISLHEGQMEGMAFNADEGWSSVTLDFERRHKSRNKLSILDEGRTVIVEQVTNINLYNYRLQLMGSIPTTGQYSLFVVRPSANFYLVLSSNHLVLHYTNFREPRLINSFVGDDISKLEACKYGTKQAVLYLSNTRLMKNKKGLCFVQTFTTYKQFLFTYSNSTLQVCTLDTMQFSTIASFQCRELYWMTADNYKLLMIFSYKGSLELGVLRHKDHQLLRYPLPANEFTEVLHRESILIITCNEIFEKERFRRVEHRVVMVNLAQL
jgi:hypothetical protein